MTRATQIADAFRNACLDELDAPKPGNVHNFAAGHRMTASDFIRSADAAAVPLARTGARVGERILAAVEATFAAVGVNTNLGIILLCAPLAAAAERQSADLRAAVTDVLAALDVEDADLAFRAIARASPAGTWPRRAARCVGPGDHHAETSDGRSRGSRSDRAPICQQFRRRIRAGRTYPCGHVVAGGRPAMGNARGLSRLPVRISGQPHRAQAWRCHRRRDSSDREHVLPKSSRV